MSSNQWAQASEAFAVKFLCVVTCLWVIFAPIYLMMRKDVKKKLVAEFPMMITGRKFYYDNYYTMYDAVKSRPFTTYVAE